MLQNFETYLHVAAYSSQSEIFQTVLDNKVTKNPRNMWGKTPLHIICKSGNFKIAKALMQVPNLDAKEKWKGETALHIACKYSYLKIVEKIIGKSCNWTIDFNAKTKGGDTVFHFAEVELIL